ncbi:MAG: hypothetical protein QOF90_3283 [Acetobacteraceae bacterium]|jgi:hypothetical protein|nr:hypothetical protein [Acetobacteraceae bacterium]
MRKLQRSTISAGAAAVALVAVVAHAQAPSKSPPAANAPAATDTQPKRTPAPADAYVYIGWPNDNETVRTTHIKVWFGTRNFGVAPAGTTKANTGHHHLLIDTALPPMDQPIPNDKNHLHFGLGQTETVIDLPPGTHTLQLLMADADHIPHDPPLISKKITIHVRAAEGPVAEAH